MTEPAHDIFWAVCMWEHRGHIRPDDISPKGAVGPAQVTPICLQDVNAFLKAHGHHTYSMAQMRDYKNARVVFDTYCVMYRAEMDERKARLLAQGPSHKRQHNRDGDAYWTGVQTYLERAKP